jgi:hypothetical protein
MNKRLIVCCDGTWQQLKSQCPTNVVKVAQAITARGKDDCPQIVFYDEGVGTGDWRDRLRGGIFGIGLDQNIQECYRFLCLNYESGDEIYLFGFSRGAYTVRSLAGIIARFGLLARNSIRLIPQLYDFYRIREEDTHYEQTVQFANTTKARLAEEHQLNTNVQVTLLGCWDTVGALGIPDTIPWLPLDSWINHRYKFHDTNLSPKVQHALHAVSIDEPLKSFQVTRMNRKPGDHNPLEEVWFPGNHGAIGGGVGDRESPDPDNPKPLNGLSDRTLQWMLQEIEHLGLGLTFDPDAIPGGLKPDPLGKFYVEPQNLLLKFAPKEARQIRDKDLLDRSVFERWTAKPEDLEPWTDETGQYRPQNLERTAHLAALNAFADRETDPLTD